MGERMEVKRVFLIVLDSAGVGWAPDAERFGDVWLLCEKREAACAEYGADGLVPDTGDFI